MNTYIATFHTHAGAIVAHRALRGRGLAARMMPVPRRLSSSCGTCVRYEARDDCRELLGEDLEALYRWLGGEQYQRLAASEEL